MAVHAISIDVYDKLVSETNPKLIPIINQPNPVKGYSANAYTVRMLMQFGNLYIYESGTDNIITGSNYYEYFPEENPGGGGGGGGMTPQEVQDLIDESISGIETTVQGIDSTASNKIVMKNGIPVYISDTEPTGDIPNGAIGFGF